MKELDQYGTAVHRYEGVGFVRSLGDTEPTPVYFDARQIDDSKIIIGCVATSGSFGDRPLCIDGRTLAGDKFLVTGDIDEAFWHSGKVNKAHYICKEMRIRHTTALEPPHATFRFALHNFVFPPPSSKPWGSLVLKVADLTISIEPVDDYVPRVERLRRYGGIAHTAWCEIRVQSVKEVPLSQARVHEMMDTLIDSFSLALGILVSWYHYIAQDIAGNLIDTVHYSPVARSFSDLIFSRGWYADIHEVAKAWLDGSTGANIKSEKLAVLVRQHLDACVRDTYLETRALSAATLLDILAGRHAEMTESNNVIDPDVWNSKVLPKLTAALNEVPGIAPEQRRQIENNLAHQYRRSFRKNLRALLTELDISIKPKQMKAIYNTRNALVHAGHFHETNHDRQVTEYLNLLLLGRSILLRIAGCATDLEPD